MPMPASPLASIVTLGPFARAQGEKREAIDDRPELFVTRKAKMDTPWYFPLRCVTGTAPAHACR